MPAAARSGPSEEDERRVAGGDVGVGSRATITSNGLITIPFTMLRQLGLRQGDLVEFEVDGEPKRLLVDVLVGADVREHADRLLTLDPQRCHQAFEDLRIEP